MTDQESHNGTFLNDQPVTRPTTLAQRDRLRVAEIPFLFALGTPSSEDLVGPSSCDLQTKDLDTADNADCGELPFSIYEPTRGGGGLLDIDGHCIRLTALQFAALDLLRARLLEDRGKAELVSGFLPSVELLATLPWETCYPNEGHVKQLVRRLRDRLADTGLRIEGRRGLGYRLVVEPLEGPNASGR